MNQGRRLLTTGAGLAAMVIALPAPAPATSAGGPPPSVPYSAVTMGDETDQTSDAAVKTVLQKLAQRTADARGPKRPDRLITPLRRGTTGRP
ncbi:hypothetical protein Q0Z83_043600 [Actinoplanes sichuanensis]|nr:hypothetical protein Q0Z83_043600 [Actinoplanes sichuanensis]